MATTALARIAFFCLRDARRGQAFLDHMPSWADLYHEVSSAVNGVEAIAAIMRHIHLVTEVPQPLLEQKLFEALGPEAKETFVPLGEQLIEQGRKKGLEQGRQEGRQEALRVVVEKLLTLKFGSLDRVQRAKLDAAGTHSLEEMSERILTADTIGDVLA
jgi:flagellar biosynthesis/type III secretory pathway protein FliH